MITRPWLLHVLIDDVFVKQDRDLLIPTLLGIAGCGVGLGIAAVFGHWAHTRAAEGAMSRMRQDVLRQAQRIPIGALRGRRTGDIVSHLTADAAVISTVYLHAGSVLFAQALRMPGYLVIMFAIDWRLGLIAVATLPIHALMATRVRGRTQAAGARVQGAMGRLTAVMTELVGGARDVKAFNRQGWAGERLDTETRGLWRARVRVALLESLGQMSHLAYWAALIAIWGVAGRRGRGRNGCGRLPGGLGSIPAASRRTGAEHLERLRPNPGCARHRPPGVRVPGHPARARRCVRAFVGRVARRDPGREGRVFLRRRRRAAPGDVWRLSR